MFLVDQIDLAIFVGHPMIISTKWVPYVLIYTLNAFSETNGQI